MHVVQEVDFHVSAKNLDVVKLWSHHTNPSTLVSYDNEIGF